MSERSPTKMKDVRDLYKLMGADALLDAPQRIWSPPTTTVQDPNDVPGDTPSGGKKQFTLIHCDQMDAALDSSDLVHNLLSHGDSSVLYGSPGAGKSFFALDLAVHVATGKPYRGKLRVDGGAVIYVTLEGRRTFRNRIAALKKKEILPPGAPLYIARPTFSLLESADSETLVNTVTELAAKINLPVRLIVIDTLSRAMAGGDESSSVDMSSAVRAVDAVRNATGAHVMLVHHSGKDQSKGARGHSSLRAAVDTEIEVFRKDGESITFAQVTKQRDLPCIASMAFTLEFVDLGLNNYGEMVTSCTVVHNLDATAVRAARTSSRVTKPVPQPEQILELVPDTRPIQKNTLRHDITTKLGASVRGADGVLAKMLEACQLYEVRVKSPTGQSTAGITRQRPD